MTSFEFKKLIRDHFHKIIEEGMDVSIEGYKYGRRLNILDELSSYLLDTVISPIIKKLPPDQVAYLRKNSPVSYYEMIAPDGSYYSSSTGGGTGIINFYIAGFISSTLQTIIKAIFNELRKLGIKWGKISKEKSRMYNSEVIRIPIIKNRIGYDGPPEMHLSNVNAYHIFHNILQYEGENEFKMDAEELKSRIASLAHDKSWVDKNIRKTKITQPPELPEPGEEWKEIEPEEKPESDEENPHSKVLGKIGKGLGAQMIDIGLTSDDIWKRLHFIYKIADWATKHGYKRIVIV